MNETAYQKLWCTRREWADLRLPGLPHTESGLVRHTKVNKDYWESRPRQSKGGGLEFSICSPSPEMLDTLRKRFYSNAEQTNEQQNDIALDAKLYAQAPSYNKKVADRYLWILKRDPGVKGRPEVKDFLDGLRLQYPDRFIPSVPTYYRIRREHYYGGKEALIGKYGKRAGSSKIIPEYLECFASLFSNQNCSSAATCRKMVLGKFGKPENINSFPLARTFKRQLERKIGKSALYLSRYGEKKWQQKYGNFIERDYGNLKAGQCWVSDHALVDVFVSVQNQKKKFRVWITGWSDMKTGKILSIFPHIDPPNSDHIFQSFYWAITTYGLPEYLYLDNGKDYRASDFAGGRKTYKLNIDEQKVSNMVSLLNIIVIFAIPYNARAKTIERIWLLFKESFSKNCNTYCGGTTIERPDNLIQKLKSNDVIDKDDFTALFEDYVRNVYNKTPSQGKVLQGRSPDDQWNLENPVKRAISRDAAKLFCMRTSRPVTISRNGVRDSELDVTYWSEWMITEKGRKVFLRRDIKDFNDAWVFDSLTDEYLGNASIFETIPALARTPIEKQHLKDAMSARRREVKLLKELGRSDYVPSVEERLLYLKRSNDLLNPDPVPESGQNVIELVRTPLDGLVLEKNRKEKAKKHPDNIEKRIDILSRLTETRQPAQTVPETPKINLLDKLIGYEGM